MTLFLDVRKFEAISLLLVFYLKEERHDECENSERCEDDHWYNISASLLECDTDDKRYEAKTYVLNPEDK